MTAEWEQTPAGVSLASTEGGMPSSRAGVRLSPVPDAVGAGVSSQTAVVLWLRSTFSGVVASPRRRTDG